MQIVNLELWNKLHNQNVFNFENFKFHLDCFKQTCIFLFSILIKVHLQYSCQFKLFLLKCKTLIGSVKYQKNYQIKKFFNLKRKLIVKQKNSSFKCPIWPIVKLKI